MIDVIVLVVASVFPITALIVLATIAPAVAVVALALTAMVATYGIRTGFES